MNSGDDSFQIFHQIWSGLQQVNPSHGIRLIGQVTDVNYVDQIIGSGLSGSSTSTAAHIYSDAVLGLIHI